MVTEIIAPDRGERIQAGPDDTGEVVSPKHVRINGHDYEIVDPPPFSKERTTIISPS